MSIGIAALIAINSTYPIPSWSDSLCEEFDHSRNSSAVITTVWSINPNPPIKRVCGYINGLLNDEFSSSARLSGAETNFVDNIPQSSSFMAKRVYCIAVEYCAGGATPIDYVCYSPCPPQTSPNSNNPLVCSPGNLARNISTTTVSYQCAVGLIYDGMPIDLNPQLGRHGVVFSFIDTSSTESRFDIYVGEFGSDDSTKTHVVTIPNGLAGCGRTANPISFTDQISSLSVGQVMEYAISATQQYQNGTGTIVAATSMFNFPYRIPFLVQVNGDVEYKAGGGVGGVSIAFCHLDRTTSVPDANPAYCPLIVLVSDSLGHFAGEIRVSDP